jgi:phosphoglycerate dehydrogenase-like enzyme
MTKSKTDRPWKVFVADPDLAEAARKLAPEYQEFELAVAAEGNPPAEPVLQGCVGLVAQFAPVDAARLQTMRDLQVVLKLGRNYYNIDVEAVRQRGMTFACAPRKGPNCVAEMALTFILSLSKDLLISHQSVAQAAYRLRGLTPEPSSQTKMAFHWMENQRVHEIRHKVLGMVGMGEIACELARRANVMGMHVHYYKRTPLSPELEGQFGATYWPLDRLLAESDYVCLAVPHTASTERLICEEELARMKPTAYLVNICRGGIVDEAALAEALRKRQIAGAGLDVFTLEPLEAESPLLALDNVILTPHIGGGTGSNRELELSEALVELGRILAGERPEVDLSTAPLN